MVEKLKSLKTVIGQFNKIKEHLLLFFLTLYLDKYNICVRAGSHCAKMLKDVFNIANTCRISLSFYNTREEIDLLINVLKNSKNIWEEIL